MNVITNAALVLKDRHGNIGTVTSLTDNDIAKIHNAIADIGKLVDPVSHLPIKATATTVGVVQLADDEAIAAGTTGRVVDAKQLQDAVMGITPANCVTNVATGSTANKIKVTKDGYTTTITIDNVEHAVSANSVQWDNILGKPSSFTPSSHTHDDRYYTESEIDAKLSDKANATDLANYLLIAGGNITGNLAVKNKNVVRSVNWVNADENGNVHLGNLGVITGKIEWFAFNTPPEGYLVCNGASVSRTTYADLFNAIGTTFGSGDGSTTFNIPDLRDRYIIGANTNALGAQIAEQLPNIKGEFGSHGANTRGVFAYANGAFSTGPIYTGGQPTYTGTINCSPLIKYNAHNSNAIYTDNGHVYPLSLALLPCIKY